MNEAMTLPRHVPMNAIYTESISDFRNSYDAALRKLALGPVLLMQRSKPAAVLVLPERWNAIAEELAEYRRLALADQQFAEIKAGKYVDLEDLEKVLSGEIQVEA